MLDAEKKSSSSSSRPTQYELVYSGTPNPDNAGKIDLKNEAANTRLILNVRCGRQTPKKGDRAVSANVTENGVNGGTGRKPDGTRPEDLKALVPGMKVTLNKNTGIVTTDGQSADASWGDASYGTTVKMTVSGSGTSSVTITYIITGNLTGGTAGPQNSMPNPVTITFIYSASKIE